MGFRRVDATITPRRVRLMGIAASISAVARYRSRLA